MEVVLAREDYLVIERETASLTSSTLGNDLHDRAKSINF